MARILIVEDTSYQRDFLATLLRRDGHDVHPARNGSEALDWLSSRTFDLILTDIFMPDCDGLELIRRIRANDTKLPIVAMSAGRRPARSAYAPINTPPSGRVTKPTPNVASERSRLVRALPLGKKARPM